MRTNHIVLYGHFGSGNIGNDATLEAMIHNIGRFRPRAKISCVCNGPEEIARRFGIETIPIDLPPWQAVHRATPSKRVALPIRFVRRAIRELAFWRTRAAWFRSIEQFIVVGTGAVDDMAVRRPWDQPLDLYRWCRVAKLGGATLAFVSVGAGPVSHPISRSLMLRALRLADYRSYRETAAFTYLADVGFSTQGDRLYPDLVFSRPTVSVRRPANSALSPSSRITVGLGLILYYGWRHDPVAGADIYCRYLEKISRLVSWLLRQGANVRLLHGDVSDQKPISDLKSVIDGAAQAEWRDRVIVDSIATMDDLEAAIAETDLVVASRFHNVVAALMLERPVISLGYHEKNDLLMAEMGLGEYCHHIESFSVDTVIDQFERLRRSGELSGRIRTQLQRNRELLDEQYFSLLGPGLSV